MDRWSHIRIEDVDGVVIRLDDVHLDAEVGFETVDIDGDVRRARPLSEVVKAGRIRPVFGVRAERIPFAPIRVLERFDIAGIAGFVVR